MRVVQDRHLVLDVDCGVDDALALMLALSLHSTVEAITCVAGNTTVSNVYRNVRRVLKKCRMDQVPVYRGCERPLTEPLDLATEYHGHDGLGGFSLDHPEEEVDGDDGEASPHASQVLVKMAREAPGKLTLLLLGPHTNAALALFLDPQFGKNLRDIFIMGGNVEGRGNVLPGSEYNFKTDPEAAHVVLTRADCPITIVPWEAVIKSPIPWHVYQTLTKQGTVKGRFFTAITRHSLRYYEKVESEGYEVGDALAVVAALAPDAVVEEYERRVAVELSGLHTRGQLVQAWTEDMLPDVKSKVRIAARFDRELVSELLIRMLI
ncbi:unnamed protein product [Ixodes hexagonus]